MLILCRAKIRDSVNVTARSAGFPVTGDTLLGIFQRQRAVADFAVEAGFEMVFPHGAVLAGPGLEGEVGKFPGMAAERKWNDVIKLVVTGASGV